MLQILYTLGQGYFKKLFCQWLAVEHSSETVFIHPVSSHPALLLKAQQTSTISCHSILGMHPQCTHCTHLVLFSLILGINLSLLGDI